MHLNCVEETSNKHALDKFWMQSDYETLADLRSKLFSNAFSPDKSMLDFLRAKQYLTDFLNSDLSHTSSDISANRDIRSAWIEDYNESNINASSFSNSSNPINEKSKQHMDKLSYDLQEVLFDDIDVSGAISVGCGTGTTSLGELDIKVDNFMIIEDMEENMVDDLPDSFHSTNIRNSGSGNGGGYIPSQRQPVVGKECRQYHQRLPGSCNSTSLPMIDSHNHSNSNSNSNQENGCENSHGIVISTSHIEEENEEVLDDDKVEVEEEFNDYDIISGLYSNNNNNNSDTRMPLFSSQDSPTHSHPSNNYHRSIIGTGSEVVKEAVEVDDEEEDIQHLSRHHHHPPLPPLPPPLELALPLANMGITVHNLCHDSKSLQGGSSSHGSSLRNSNGIRTDADIFLHYYIQQIEENDNNNNNQYPLGGRRYMDGRHPIKNDDILIDENNTSGNSNRNNNNNNLEMELELATSTTSSKNYLPYQELHGGEGEGEGEVQEETEGEDLPQRIRNLLYEQRQHGQEQDNKYASMDSISNADSAVGTLLREFVDVMPFDHTSDMMNT